LELFTIAFYASFFLQQRSPALVLTQKIRNLFMKNIIKKDPLKDKKTIK
tara:strand:+ start:5186 stop:5332 length:147 start_codon:yes stop_codon:yes gene_type:complete